ncbi:MAG: glycosyltransferase family 4 protein [Flavobacteriaceae bacterium]|nr:glycosyltransferase family 4 protein [Flavobacteriaceae bacterium]
MKVLIITYYWPPAGGSGVQRWLKFVKYLRDFDIEPVVYTVDDAQYALIDESLESEIPKNIKIIKHCIWEPNSLFSKIKNKQQQSSAGFLNKNPTFFEKKLQYIRANYFIPDARKFWVKPSVKTLSKYLENNKIDVIISTGPPHSMHLIGIELQEKFNLKWIVDFRDPWTEIDYFHQLPLTLSSKQKHLELERKVLQKADAVIVVGKTMKENFNKFNKNIHVISNGYDGVIEDEFATMDNKFSLTHIGMMNADRNSNILWESLSELINEDPVFGEDLQVNLIGKVADAVVQSIQNNKLKKLVEWIDYVPHQKVMDYQRSTQVLLLLVNKVPAAKGILTGKIFEYLQAKRPILAIGPKDGDLAEIINNTKSGFIVDFNDKINLKRTIKDLYKQYKAKDLNIRSKDIEQYHRKKLTQQLAQVIKGIK